LKKKSLLAFFVKEQNHLELSTKKWHRYLYGKTEVVELRNYWKSVILF